MRTHIEDLVERLFPGGTVERVRELGSDEGKSDAATEKGIGYGKPLMLTIRTISGQRSRLVLHTAIGDDFGHDRRSDRAEEMLLAYDTFGAIARHVRPLDVGFIERNGHLRSVRDSGEFYLVTEFAPGEIYAEDLRRIARQGSLDDRDRRRCDILASDLAELHSHRGGRPAVYTRAIRDLVGHGEGIFGLIDGYPPDVPSAPRERLRAIEARCVTWRWRLRGREHRLTLTHGDFHPFNILFDEDDNLALLDAARGCHGDPADDVVCLALNYIFFAVGHDGAWHGNLGQLWHQFWQGYIEQTSDFDIFDVAPPFLAWRGLVMANPQWYPAVTPESRDLLLRLIEKSLEQGHFDPASVEALF